MMNSYDYSICGLHLHLETEKEIWTEPYGEVFACPPGPEDLRLTFRSVPELPEPEGRRCGNSREYPTWRIGDRISRCSWDLFRAQMHARTDYSLDRPDEAICSVREEDWRWATRTKYLWTGAAINSLLLHFRALIFHASYIGHEGRGILFTAPSGTGKSTQAELWRVHRGARVLNGDKAGVSLRETPMAHGVPFSGTSGICENVSLPLKAVVVLSQAPENTIRRLGPSEAAAALCPNLFVDQAIPEEWQLALNLLLDLVASVPVYALACTPDERAVETLEQVLNQQTDRRELHE